MSKSDTKKPIGLDNANLGQVKVEVLKHKQRRNTHTAVPYTEVVKGGPKVSSRSHDFVYVNSAYVGSLNSVSDVRIHQPPTSVYREQYWTCSKWSFAKRVMTVVAGVVLGAAIGLAVIMAIKGKGAEDVIAGIFKSSPAPD